MSRRKTRVTFTSNRKQHVRKLKRARDAGLRDAIMLAHGDALLATPVDTGALRASLAYAVSGRRQHRATKTGRDGKSATSAYEVTAPEGVARLGSNLDYAPKVHEDLDTPRRVGGPKFIEKPMREGQERYLKAMRARTVAEMNR